MEHMAMYLYYKV